MPRKYVNYILFGKNIPWGIEYAFGQPPGPASEERPRLTISKNSAESEICKKDSLPLLSLLYHGGRQLPSTQPRRFPRLYTPRNFLQDQFKPGPGEPSQWTEKHKVHMQEVCSYETKYVYDYLRTSERASIE